MSEGLVTFSSGWSSTTVHFSGAQLFLVSSGKTSTRSLISHIHVQFQQYGWQLERKQVEACGNDSDHKELKENYS